MLTCFELIIKNDQENDIGSDSYDKHSSKQSQSHNKKD